MRLLTGWFFAVQAVFVLAFNIQPDLASASEPNIRTLPYYDDRSSPQTLVHSLYNAINRREFARAYSYFGTPPAASVEIYARGFDDTELVQIVTGSSMAEGAAGSSYQTLPIAIRSIAKGGGETVFAGCLTARLANPSIQASDFRPWHIERTTIRPSDEPFARAIPDCDAQGRPVPQDYTIPVSEADPSLLATVIGVQQAFLQRYGMICDDSRGTAPTETIALPPRKDDGSPSEPTTVLVGFICGFGAYNQMTVWMTASDPAYAVSHDFAEPEIDYELGASTEEGVDGPVETIDIVGWKTTDQLINAGWDSDSHSLTTYAKWRGIGDAYSTATYEWNGSEFVLTSFAVDPSFDQKQDAITIFSRDTPQNEAGQK
ncbi:DUF1176 domain-containing protein [Notoacmeibacter sp. MSK16QG-6]|uniref:DUF1176 domain-containing protein n=1 Tax=Notoacmeibacter sp. MSK16QG-6 TaxID=2957982 RepID=UPI00209F1F33|nr:DUF1176 domain-containing protein [Notoacmeibacter sp. MSK16QG-6]MCP1198166.1 DUF1176 domain-containing protein [Notoacmeibacter sp. MSK16QG-6]